MFKLKKLRLDPIYVVILAVLAALPFLVARLISPGSFGGRGQAIPAPTLSMSLPDEAAAWAAETLGGLTLEKKIAQLITADIAGGYIADDDPRLARWLSLARDHGVGMFVLYGGTPRDVARLLNRLQRAATVPLLISADFEGGPGQQVSGASEYPAAASSRRLLKACGSSPPWPGMAPASGAVPWSAR